MKEISFWDKEFLRLVWIMVDVFKIDGSLLKLFDQTFTRIDTPIVPQNFNELVDVEKNKIIENLRKVFDLSFFCDKENKNLETICNQFSLSKKERLLLIFFYLHERFYCIQDFLADKKERDIILIIEHLTDLTKNEIFELLKPNSKFSRFILIEFDKSNSLRISHYDIKVSISQFASLYLDNIDNKSLGSFYCDDAPESQVSLSSFNISNAQINTCLATLKKSGGGIVLLYGNSGMGKTEFSKCISQKAGLKPRFLKPANFNGKTAHVRLASQVFNADSDVLVIDGAESFLNTDSNVYEKARTVDFYNNLASKIIFIVNHTMNIDPFIYFKIDTCIHFESITTLQRENFWNELDKDNYIFTPKQKSDFSKNYPVSLSRIKQVHDLCFVLTKERFGMREVIEAAEELMNQSLKIATSGKGSSNDTHRIDTSLISSSIPAENLIDRISQWKNCNDPYKEGLNVLFYGIPGTGKTAYAKHIAYSLGYTPKVCRASDLLRMYVGQTEQHIREAFEEAKNGCLIIDEADSFLSDRSFSQRTWERTMVNEFLTCMESFNGLFIATTNFTKLLDEASRRRFQYKVEFFAPEQETKQRMVLFFFPHLSKDEKALDQITQLKELTIGDFSTVAKRLKYVENPSPEMICMELKEEKQFGKQTETQIGF